MSKEIKSPVVTLQVKGEERTQKFELQHALEILRLTNSAWEIKDKDFKFEDNDIKRNTSVSIDKESSK